MTEQFFHQEYLTNVNVEDKKRKIGPSAMTNMMDAAHWLGDKTKAYALYDHFVETHGNKGVKKLFKGHNIDPQLLSELVMGMAWANKRREKPLEAVRDETLQKYFETRERGFDSSYAADTAVLAESHGVSVLQVMELIKRMKVEPRIVATKAEYWSTSVTLASAIMAEGMDEKKVIDTYVELNRLTSGKETESVLAALLQASLLSSIAEVMQQYRALLSQKIVESWPRKKEKVSDGSKAFLVLAMVVGHKSETEVVRTMQTLMNDNKLEQDTAARLILADANKNSESPVLCRQGSFTTSHDEIGLDIGTGIPLDGIPGDGGMAINTETTTHYYSAAIRLASQKL